MYPKMIKLGYSPFVTLKLVDGISPQEKRRTNSCKPVFIGPLFLKTTLILQNLCSVPIIRRDQKKEHDVSYPILIIEIFDFRGLDFMGASSPLMRVPLHFIGS